ncbi:hypothetical protein ACNTMW_27390 [Planosporangium sp. 12N6]|uniref:hypothetical protein n=1 Tax=Planosporangium spinosum TaxID=3402278 RepID=UPI003CF03C27
MTSYRIAAVAAVSGANAALSALAYLPPPGTAASRATRRSEFQAAGRPEEAPRGAGAAGLDRR